MHIQTIHIYGVANDSKKIGGKKGRVDLEGNNNWLRIGALQCYHFFLQCTILFTCEYFIHSEDCLTLVFLHANFMRILPRFS